MWKMTVVILPDVLPAYPFIYVRKLLLSFRRKPESRILKSSWTPAFAGVTTSVDGVLFKSTKLTPGLLSPA